MADLSVEETSVSTPPKKRSKTDEFLPEESVSTDGRQWVTEFQDSGETVEWVASTYNADGTIAIPGTAREGYYVGSDVIELKEDQINPDVIDPSTGMPKTQAQLLIFEDENEERWNTWESYQIKEDRFQEGSYYRIECKRERKTAKGAMKSFKIMRDPNAQR